MVTRSLVRRGKADRRHSPPSPERVASPQPTRGIPPCEWRKTNAAARERPRFGGKTLPSRSFPHVLEGGAGGEKGAGLGDKRGGRTRAQSSECGLRRIAKRRVVRWKEQSVCGKEVWSLQPSWRVRASRSRRELGARPSLLCPAELRGRVRDVGRAGELAEPRRAACRTVPSRGSLERGRRGSHHKSPRG